MKQREFIEPSEFEQLFVKSDRLIDVRSPIEVEQAELQNSINLPLLTTAEREAVGKRYKERGQAEAIALGNVLVSGELKTERVAAWESAITQGNCTALFCARGGLRSEIAQRWISEQNIFVPRVRGGYKALRHTLLSHIERDAHDLPLLVVTGRTGVGKTLLLNKLASRHAVIDLENLARHRGSAFGDVYGGQPTQASFENSLACQIVRYRHECPPMIFLEAESRAIGRVRVPATLAAVMKACPLIELTSSVEERAKNIIEDYVEEMLKRFRKTDDESAFQRLREYLTLSLSKIERKLGGMRYKNISGLLQDALTEHRATGISDVHSEWVKQLLLEYYDPMYDWQIEASRERIRYSGNHEELLTFVAEQVVSSNRVEGSDIISGKV